MACYGTGGDGGTAPGANTLVKADDVPVLPSFAIVVGYDDIGGLDESELQVLVGLFGKVSIMDLSSGTGDLGGGAAIGGEGIGVGESGNIPDLTIDDDRQDIPNTGKRFQQLDARGFLDAKSDTFFEGGDFPLDKIEQYELVLGTALGLRWQEEDRLIQPAAAGLAE